LQYPYVTGTSVLALKYKDGVLMACDTLASYGSTKRYKSVERMKVRPAFETRDPELHPPPAQRHPDVACLCPLRVASLTRELPEQQHQTLRRTIVLEITHALVSGVPC
jgi:hypothetical protein